MADVREKILSKFDINIEQVNLLKLYKIESADISQEDLEAKIEACRKKWNQSVNGANEKFAERDRAHLEKANAYEKILKDKKLRKELFAYYKKESSSSGDISFAKEYFKLMGKKIDKKDVDFFFKYFQNERKNKKAILDMLKNDFKVYGLGKEEKFASEGEEIEAEGKKKNENSPLITNLFQEATILKIHKCEQFLEIVSKSEEVRNRYSNLEDGLDEFLSIEKYKELPSFISDISKKREEAANYRLDRGQDYTPLVDLFNTMAEITTYKDVVDNFTEFKLLLKYPKLSPYMYMFKEVKPDTLKVFYERANAEYPFRDIYDFVSTYFQPIYDNFGILDKGIGAILKKAEQKAKANKVLNAVDEALGRKKRAKVPFIANIVHYAVYWPIYLLYLVFELFRAVIAGMRKSAVPLFVMLFAGINWIQRDESLLTLRYIFNKSKWLPIVNSYTKEWVMDGAIESGFEIFTGSLFVIILKVLMFTIPPLVVALLVYSFAEHFSQSVDWVGLERTFRGILKTLKAKTEKQYSDSIKIFYKKKLVSILINILCVALLCLLIYLLPIILLVLLM